MTEIFPHVNDFRIKSVRTVPCPFSVTKKEQNVPKNIVTLRISYVNSNFKTILPSQIIVKDTATCITRHEERDGELLIKDTIILFTCNHTHAHTLTVSDATHSTVLVT